MKRLALITMILAICSSAFAVSAEPLTLEEAIEDAKKSSESLEIAYLENDKAARSNSKASLFIPDISLSGSLTTTGSIAGNTISTPLEGDLSISMAFSTSIFASLDEMETAIKQADMNLQDSIVDLEKSVTETYYTLAGMKEALAETEKSYELAKTSYEKDLERYNNGLTDYLSLRSSELNMLEAESALNDAKATYSNAVKSFSVLLGQSVDDYDYTDMPDPVPFEIASTTDIVNATTTTSSYLKGLDIETEIAESALRKTKSTYMYPTLSLSLSTGFEGRTDFGSSDIFQDTTSLSFGVSIPISAYIPSSSANNNVKNAEADVEIAKLQKQSGLETYRTTIDSYRSSLEQAFKNVELDKSKLSLAEETLSLAWESFDAGLISSTELSEYEESRLNASIELTSSKLEAAIAEYELSTYIGRDIRELSAMTKKQGE